MDLDDLVCDIKQIPLITNTLNVNLENEGDFAYWFSYIGSLEFMANYADGFITTNDYLGGLLEKKFHKPYYVIKNSLNDEQINMSVHCLDHKYHNNEKFMLGYFSGSPSHINDFKIIESEIIQLLNEYPEITLKVVGYMEFSTGMQELIRKKRVIFSPFVSFIELQRLIAEVNVNLVPLVQNTFTNCKSELKYFEASVVKTITVATPTYTYQHAIRDGETGFLANPGQWYEIISDIYNKKIDAEVIVDRACEECMNTYFGKSFLEEIEGVYNKMCKSK